MADIDSSIGFLSMKLIRYRFVLNPLLSALIVRLALDLAKDEGRKSFTFQIVRMELMSSDTLSKETQYIMGGRVVGNTHIFSCSKNASEVIGVTTFAQRLIVPVYHRTYNQEGL